jgi:hypothetical protein
VPARLVLTDGQEILTAKNTREKSAKGAQKPFAIFAILSYVFCA